MTAAHGVIAILESTFNSLDVDNILALYADDAKLTAHCEFSCCRLLCRTHSSHAFFFLPQEMSVGIRAKCHL